MRKQTVIIKISVLDDSDKNSQQNKMMVGSFQGASKNTVTHGETKKYGGLIFTKNFDPSKDKMPDKVVDKKKQLIKLEIFSDKTRQGDLDQHEEVQRV